MSINPIEPFLQPFKCSSAYVVLLFKHTTRNIGWPDRSSHTWVGPTPLHKVNVAHHAGHVWNLIPLGECGTQVQRGLPYQC